MSINDIIIIFIILPLGILWGYSIGLEFGMRSGFNEGVEYEQLAQRIRDKLKNNRK